MTTPAETTTTTPASGPSVTVTVTHQLSWFDTFKARIKALRFDKPFIKLWRYRMWLHFGFFAQGFISLISLSFFGPNLTHKPSLYLAVQKSVCDDILADEAQAKIAADNNEEYVSKIEVFEDEDAEMEAWLANQRKKKEYDHNGQYKGLKE